VLLPRGGKGNEVKNGGRPGAGGRGPSITKLSNREILHHLMSIRRVLSAESGGMLPFTTLA